MTALDRLVQAHRRMTPQLMVLESALDMGPEAWFVIREACWSLSMQLRAHIAAEQRLVGRRLHRLHRLGPDEWRRAAVDHHDVARRLQAMNEVLAGDPCFSLSGLRPTLAWIVQALRRQIEEQEAALFPLLSFVSMVQEVFGREVPAAPGPRWTGQAPAPRLRRAPRASRNLLDTARRRW